MTVVVSAFIAETQTAHALEKKAGGLDGEYSIFFLPIQLDCLEKPGRKRVVLIWLGSCALARLCFVYNDHKITSYLKRCGQ